MAHDVFISHSSQDKTIADAVCAALETEAVRCWIAPRDVQPGRSFAGEITRAIQRSKVMVLIFSKHSNASEQVLREVQLAANSRLHIVQFRIQDIVSTADLEYYLSTPHWLDALSPPLESHLGRLQTSVKALLLLGAEEAPEQMATSVVPSAPEAKEGKTAPVVAPDLPPPRVALVTPTQPEQPPPPSSPVATVPPTQTKESSVYAKRAGWIAAGVLGLLFVFAILKGPGVRDPSSHSTTPAPQPHNTPASSNVATGSGGDLWIKTIPAGADVVVDGVIMKTTPATFSGLAIGRHRLVISLEGYQTTERDVEVKAGQVAMPDAIALVAKPVVVNTEPFDGVWVARPDKKSSWGSTLTINGTRASITVEFSENLPRKSSGWEHFPAPYNKSPTLFYQWSTEAKSVQVSGTAINIFWNEWTFSWEPRGIPYAVLLRNYRRPTGTTDRSFDLVVPPPKDWGFTLQGSDLQSGGYTFHRRR
ncbi:MAG: hypothetical protein JWO45_228 [Spartobacteria bacterium]|nr:hypothetical protein [Spartobacteria bacterium]